MEALENAIVTANDELATLYARPSERPQEGDRPRRYGGTRFHRRLAISCPGDGKQRAGFCTRYRRCEVG